MLRSSRVGARGPAGRAGWWSIAAVVAACGAAGCGGGSQGFDAGGDAQDVAQNPDAARTDGGIDAADAFDAASPDALPPDGGPDAADAMSDAAPDAPRDVPTDGPPMCIGGPDAGSDAAISPPGTYTFVASELSIERDDSPSAPHTGFNIDGLVSGSADADGCNHADFLSVLDPDQNAPSGCVPGAPSCRGGVDNQLPALADEFESLSGSDLRAAMAAQVNSSRLVLLVRVTGVDDFMNDNDVRVQILFGYPTFSTGCTAVLPDREYQIAQSSLRPGGLSPDDAVFNVPGRIVAGRLRADAAPADVLRLPLPGLGGVPLAFTLRAIRLGVDITASLGTRGNVGGKVSGNELRDELVRAVPAFRVIIEDIIRQRVDIREMGVCTDTTVRPPRYGSLGMGLGMRMVRARIATDCPISDRPTPGVCGTM